MMQQKHTMQEQTVLKDDDGNYVSNDRGHVLDFTIPEAANWWVSLPFLGNDGKGNWNGIPVAKILDGVLADGANRPNSKISIRKG